MKIFVTDEGMYWNHENPILERYADCVVVVCLNGKKVTDKYECFVSPYKHMGLGVDNYGVTTAKFQALKSVEDELRQTYTAAEKSIKNTLSGKKYVFWKMQPYAAILDEKGHASSVAEYKAKDFKESVGKDLVEGAVTAVADKFNIKALKYKKYVCVNQAGRTFTTYLEDIPALLMSAEGKASDVYKNDALYPMLGEPIAPAINIVHALLINTKDKSYIFYGNGIQIEDIGAEYERLKLAISEYRLKGKNEKGNKMIETLSRISFPKLSKKQIMG